jgi:hypothetical protein
MLNLKFIIYFICFFIVVHFGLHFFDIDVFELFEKPVTEPNTSKDTTAEITDTISELEKSIQELKDVSNI